MTNLPLNVVGLRIAAHQKRSLIISARIKPWIFSKIFWMPRKNMCNLKTLKFDGKITWFSVSNDKRWYNLAALIKHIINTYQKSKEHTIIKGFYGPNLLTLLTIISSIAP